MVEKPDRLKVENPTILLIGVQYLRSVTDVPLYTAKKSSSSSSRASRNLKKDAAGKPTTF